MTLSRVLEASAGVITASYDALIVKKRRAQGGQIQTTTSELVHRLLVKL